MCRGQETSANHVLSFFARLRISGGVGWRVAPLRPEGPHPVDPGGLRGQGDVLQTDRQHAHRLQQVGYIP